jgi:hypothetical protein
MTTTDFTFNPATEKVHYEKISMMKFIEDHGLNAPYDLFPWIYNVTVNTTGLTINQ